MRITDGTDLPNPGSDVAIALGCTCPILDNGHGHVPPWGGGADTWWIDMACPLHSGEIVDEGRTIVDVIDDL